MKKTIHLTVFLAVVAALCTGVLATVNMFTKDIIAEQNASAETAALKELYPEASKITVIDDFEADENNLVQAAYQIDDSAYAFRVSSQGYAEPIVYIIGFDADGSNSKYMVLEVKDTQGIGDRVAQDEYIKEMSGKATTDAFPLISGATKSSEAIVKGIGAAVEVFNAITGSTGGPSTPEPTPTEPEIVIINETEADGIKTYEFSAPGFMKATPNEYKLSIDTTTHTVTELINTVFNDTPDIGDMATANSHLEQFVGLSVFEAVSIDIVSGATVTSESINTAVQFIFDTYASSIDYLVLDGKVIVNVDAFGYSDTPNKVRVTFDQATSTILEVVVTEFNDTPGLGDQATTADRLAQYVSKSVTDDVNIDTVSGATETSDAINKAVAQAVQIYNEGGAQ